MELPTPLCVRGQCSAVSWFGFFWEACSGRKRAFCGWCVISAGTISFPHSWSVRPWEKSWPQVHRSAVPLLLAALTNFAEGLPELCHLLLREMCCRCHPDFCEGQVCKEKKLVSFGALWVCSCDETERGFHLGFQSFGAAHRSWKPSSSLYPEIKWRDKILCRWNTILWTSCCFARPCSKLQQFYLY